MDLLDITSSTVIEHLRTINQSASHGYPTDFEGRCVQFILENKLSVQNTYAALEYAKFKKNKDLMRALYGDIADQLQIFSRSSQFLQLTMDELRGIVCRWLRLATRNNNEVLFGALVRWLLHVPREKRMQYIDQVFHMLKFKCLGLEFMKVVVRELIAEPHCDHPFIKRITPSGSEAVVAQCSRRAIRTAVPKLYVYVKCQNKPNTLKIFSIEYPSQPEPSVDLSNCIHKTCEIPLAADAWIRSVPLNDSRLYTLHYYNKYDADSKKPAEYEVQFRSYVSVDMTSGTGLRPPPNRFQDLCMCSIDSNIYAYDRMYFPRLETCSDESSGMFTSEELNRSVILYNGELDTWLPVSAARARLRGSCVTMHCRLFYVLGGHDPTRNDGSMNGFAQAYDCRADEWIQLPRSGKDYRIGALCCTVGDRIYICSGADSARWTLEAFDPRAGKWEIIIEDNQRMHFQNLVSYSNRIWAMGSYPSLIALDVFDPIKLTSVQYERVAIAAGLHTGPFIDSLVFKPL